MTLTRNDLLRLLATGQPLPQEEHPEIDQALVDMLRKEEARLLDLVFEAALSPLDDQGMVNRIGDRVAWLFHEYSWFAASSVLMMGLSQKYRAADVEGSLTLSDETRGLLAMFSEAAEFGQSTDAAWTIPVNILASAGEGKSLEVVTSAALCAAFNLALRGEDE